MVIRYRDFDMRSPTVTKDKTGITLLPNLPQDHRPAQGGSMSIGTDGMQSLQSSRCPLIMVQGAHTAHACNKGYRHAVFRPPCSSARVFLHRPSFRAESTFFCLRSTCKHSPVDEGARRVTLLSLDYVFQLLAVGGRIEQCQVATRIRFGVQLKPSLSRNGECRQRIYFAEMKEKGNILAIRERIDHINHHPWRLRWEALPSYHNSNA